MPSNHIILCRLLLLLPSVFPSIRVFVNESTLRIRGPKYWSFSISPSNEYSEWISYRIDWFDLFAIQGTLKSPSSTIVWSISSMVLSLLYDPDFSLGWRWKLTISVPETSTWETKHRAQRVGELRFIMPVGTEELTLQALSPKQRDYRVFIDRV